jgi:hypothetical protein
MAPNESDSAERLLIEVQLSDAPGRIVADGRFVLEVKDGVGRLVEQLRALGSPHELYRFDLRVSELLQRSERDELERLRRIVRALPREAD